MQDRRPPGPDFEDGIENIPLPVGDKALTKVLITEDLTLVGGESGALVYSRDGKEFKSSKGVGNEHLLGFTQFKGKYYACTYSGIILSSSDGVSWKADKKLSDKPLIAIAASSSYLMAITEDTDIFKSRRQRRLGCKTTTQNIQPGGTTVVPKNSKH